jgi:hypothetical protein
MEIDAPRLDGRTELLDLIGEAAYGGADWVAVPAAALPEDFFELRSGLAGEVTQKFVQYGVGLAVVGDVSERTARSRSLRDRAALDARLAEAA